MKVSFILPIYKVEKYLRQCVESLTQQTYRDIEIILVDDGSPDGSPALCDQLASEDSRIRVIHKNNGGAASARNVGVKVASGDYLIFVDGDDFWRDNSYLDALIKIAEQHMECDCINFNCSYYYEHSQKYSNWAPYEESLAMPLDKNEIIIKLVRSGTFPMSPCLKLIKRTSYINNNIQFPEGTIAEDIPWFIDLIENASYTIYLNDYVYAYRQNVGSSVTASAGERGFFNLLNIIKGELQKVPGRSFSDDAKDSLRSFLAYEVSILMAGICGLPKEKQVAARKELKSLCWLLKYTQNPKVKMVNKVYGIFGYSITERILRLYNKYRASKC